jgi:Zn-dependent protease/CBS domain-containing protein
MEASLRLGRIAGVRVGVHWSVAVVAGLLAWSLATVTLPDADGGRSAVAYWSVGALTAVAFLSSILVHELSHATVARRNGVEVEDITLWLFGGMARLRGAAGTAGAELRIALAGPLASAAIAALALALSALATAAGADGLVGAALAWLGVVNVVLLTFNLVPAAPLDGGRVLSAALWKRWGDEDRAHRSAARVGRWFGSVLVALGLLFFVAGDVLGGLWFAFIGWFLVNTARAEEDGAMVHSAIEGRRAHDLMTAGPVVAPSWFTLEAFVDGVVQRWPYAAFPVVDRRGEVVGLIGLRALRVVPRRDWSTCTVLDVATPLDQVGRVAPDDPSSAVVEAMQRTGDGRVLVFDAGRLVGIVSPTDIARLVDRVALVGPRRRGRARDVQRR